MTEAEAQHRIAADLLRLGVRPGGVLLVHASLRALGHVPGGAETVVLALHEAVGAEGTLLLPALSYETVGPDQPVFDLAHTPACVGAIPEHFRRRPGARRSIHPTHSVCGVGPLSGQLLGAHHLDDTPCGPRSPFALLREAGGQILMLGCGLKPNTSMHGVEERVEPPYLFRETVTYEAILPDGRRLKIPNRRHDFRGYAQRYDRIEPLMPAGGLKTGPVLSATVHLLDAKTMWQVAEAALRQDPLCFVEPA